MLAMYLRMIAFFLLICAVYLALIYFVPVTGQKIDSTLGVDWNTSLIIKIDELLGKAKEAESRLEEKLDNPAPNTSRNIKGRIGQ